MARDVCVCQTSMPQVRHKPAITAHRLTSHEKSHPDGTVSETMYNNTNAIKSTTQEESIIQDLIPMRWRDVTGLDASMVPEEPDLI